MALHAGGQRHESLNTAISVTFEMLSRYIFVLAPLKRPSMVSYIDQAKGSVSKAWLNLDDWVLCPLFPPKLPPPLELVDLEGKRVLVTGSNSGIGKEMALFFAGHGADVFLLCRSDCPHETPASEVRDDIKAKTGNTNVHVEVLDMSSFDGVKGFVERWSTRSPDDRRIDILMNNAGVSKDLKTQLVLGDPESA